jgi:hypothetical protein
MRKTAFQVGLNLLVIFAAEAAIRAVVKRVRRA